MNVVGIKLLGVHSVKDERYEISANEERMKRDINESGGCSHIMHNCVHSRYNTLLIGVVALTVKICNYFYVYTVPDTELVQRFCDEAYTKYTILPQMVARIFYRYFRLYEDLSKCTSL
jgi:hypothetical protein